MEDLKKEKDSLAQSNEELLDKSKNDQKTVEELQQKIKDLNEAYEKEKRAAQDLKEAMDSIDKEKRKLKAENAQLKSQLESNNINEQLEELHDDIEDRDKTIAELKQSIMDLQEVNSTATASITRLQRTVDSQVKLIELKTMQAEDYKERYTQCMQAEDSSQASHENKVIQVLKANMQKKEATMESLYQSIDTLSNTVEEHEAQIRSKPKTEQTTLLLTCF